MSKAKNKLNLFVRAKNWVVGKLFDVFSRYVRPWFFEDEGVTVKPIRVVISCFAIMALIVLADKFFQPLRLSDTFVLGLLTALAGLIGADVWRRNGKDKFNGGG